MDRFIAILREEVDLSVKEMVCNMAVNLLSGSIKYVEL